MATWPLDNDKITGSTPNSIKPANRSISSAGYTMSYPKGTILKKSWVIEYTFLTTAEWTTANTFFDANQGNNFTFIDPDPTISTSYTVVFDQDGLEFGYVRRFPGPYSLTLKIREA